MRGSALPALLLAVLLTPAATGVEIIEWDTLLRALRTGRPGPYAVYLGSPHNHLPRLLAAGSIPTSQMPVAIVAAGDRVLNPMANEPISGAELQAFFAASAGTLLFLDERGLPIPQLAMPQAMHGDDPDLFALYFGYVGAGHHRSMAIGEYCRALGHDGVITRALQRIRHGFAGRELRADEALVTATNHLTGATIDPWAEPGVFHCYASSGDGRVLLAQIAEIHAAFAHLSPRITVIVPDGEQPDLSRLPPGVQCVLAHASRAAIQGQGPSPLVVFTASAGEQRRGLRLHGFQPADVLARLLGLPLLDATRVNRDIPYAEIDEPEAGAPRAGAVTLSVATPAAHLAPAVPGIMADDAR